MCNVWILAMHEDEPKTASGAIYAPKFLHKNDGEEFLLHLYKRVTHNETLRNECRSTFDQFQKISTEFYNDEDARKM